MIYIFLILYLSGFRSGLKFGFSSSKNDWFASIFMIPVDIGSITVGYQMNFLRLKKYLL